MKKSLIINMNSNKINELPEQFKNYLPKENSCEKITTLNVIDYDYLYITNYDKNTIANFASIFGKEEEFFVQDDSYSKEELENICLAYEKATYTFKRDKKFTKKHSSLSFINESDVYNESTIIANAISTCKDLVNKPSNELTTTSFAKFLEEMAKKHNLEFNEITKDQLIEMGAGGILAVNKGSLEDARIVKINYNGNSSSSNKYTLVGKGLIFDTGGYSLKPSASIQSMKSDMGGAATCASVFEAVVALKLNINLELVIPITDNLINEKAYRPDDVITFMNGLTTEIISTDAEGRLILADALTIASESKPNLIIDIATLTGAVINALGNDTTGVFGNDTTSINNLIKCCESNGEYAWHLPINDSHREQIKGNVATLKNGANPAGASTAAAFLENFIEENNWIHLDIAGTSWSDKSGATGAMVRPLVKFFSEIEG